SDDEIVALNHIERRTIENPPGHWRGKNVLILPASLTRARLERSGADGCGHWGRNLMQFGQRFIDDKALFGPKAFLASALAASAGQPPSTKWRHVARRTL